MLSRENMTRERESAIALLYYETKTKHLLSQPEDCEDVYGDQLVSSELIFEGQARIRNKDQHTGRGRKEIPAGGTA